MVSLKEFGKWRRETTWRTADGRSLKIHEMTDKHIINVIWHINENLSHYGKELFHNFIHEANFRGLEWAPKRDYTPTYCHFCNRAPCRCMWGG